jgi:hypothetical protein
LTSFATIASLAVRLSLSLALLAALAVQLFLLSFSSFSVLSVFSMAEVVFWYFYQRVSAFIGG